MKDNFTLVDLTGVISFVPFLFPENILTLYEKWIIFLIGIIIYLIFKLIPIIIKNNTLNKEKAELNKNRNALASQFEEKNKIIDNLQSVNYNYQQLMVMLLQSLNNLILIKDTDKEYISNLIRLLLVYKKYMEDIKNGR